MVVFDCWCWNFNTLIFLVLSFIMEGVEDGIVRLDAFAFVARYAFAIFGNAQFVLERRDHDLGLELVSTTK